MHELDAAERWIAGRLTGRPELTALAGNGQRVFSGTVPTGQPLPVVLMDVVPTADWNTQGSRGATEFEAIVRALGEGHDATFLYALAAEIDVALHDTRGDENGFEFYCERTTPFRLVEPDEGRVHIGVGGVYRLVVRPGID